MTKETKTPTTTAEPSKGALQSRTLWGLVMLVPTFLQQVLVISGHPQYALAIDGILGSLSAVLGVLGVPMATYGRLTTSQPIEGLWQKQEQKKEK